jgi:threonine dehydrogenase-like Zn-dependent dehydrogenase
MHSGMRALFFDRELGLRRDYPDPAPAPGESTVRVDLAGICGTDLEISRGYMDYRGVPGHEFVGHVVDSADPALLGRRVAGEINAACGKCRECRRGLQRHCLNRTVLGILGRDGAFAEYLRLPNSNLLPVPNSIPNEAAVFVEPIAAAYEIIEQRTLEPGSEALVLGDGRLAAIVAMTLAAEGFRIMVSGHHRDKVRRISELAEGRNGSIIAADTLEAFPDQSYETVIDCTGNPSGFARALELVRPRGTIVLKSTAAASGALNLAPVVIKEITIVGSRCGRFAPALDALAAGKFDPRPLIDGIFPLADGVAAFGAAAAKQNFKVLLKCT